MTLPLKPSEIFDRDDEWNDLARFALDAAPGATLGVVSGRRRQGKTLLLYSLAQATGGLYFAATEATEADSLRRLGQIIADHLGAPAPLRLSSWEQAIDVLLEIGRNRRRNCGRQLMPTRRSSWISTGSTAQNEPVIALGAGPPARRPARSPGSRCG